MAQPLNGLQLYQQYQANDQARALGEQQLALGPMRQQAMALDLAAKQEGLMRQDRAQRSLEQYQRDTIAQRDRALSQRSQVPHDQIIEIADPNDPTKAIKINARTRERLGESPPKASIAGASKLDDESAKNLAIESLYDHNATQGFRRDTATMGQIMKHRTQIMKDAGITPQDVVSGRAGFKADTVSLNKITPQYDAITAFENTAIRNGKILTQLVDTVDSTGVPFVEKWIRAGRQATGDPEVAKFNAQINLYRAEVARILTQPNLSGVLTDSARKEAEEFLKGSASAKQIKDVVSLLERDFDNRKHTLEDQIGSIRSRMNKRVSPGGAEQAAQPAPGAPVVPNSPTPAPKATVTNW